MHKIHLADRLDLLESLESDSIDSVITDPPYALVGKGAKSGGFMGKKWDACLPPIGVWQECLRVLKPGGYLLAFGGTRTYHRLTCSIEDAGFEIRDSILANTYEDIPAFLAWEYGSGYPKSKACLKPAWEPIALARKPGPKVLPLGIEGCKVGTDVISQHGRKDSENHSMSGRNYAEPSGRAWKGRYPPNLLLVHHPECEAVCHESCVVRSLAEPSRFFPAFYCPKASRIDRNEGCEGMERHSTAEHDGRNQCVNGVKLGGSGKPVNGTGRDMPSANHHATVKPTALMEWLVRLVCPIGGTVLDPHMGSGSTGKACIRMGRDFIGCDNDPESYEIAKARIEHETVQEKVRKAKTGTPLFDIIESKQTA